MSPRIASEREWIAAAIKQRRLDAGLRQKDLAELISAGGPRITQQMLGKIETGDKELTIFELAAVCIALGTTLDELLFPVVESRADEFGQAPVNGDVVPALLRFGSGKTLDTDYLSAILQGKRITPDGAAFGERMKLAERNAAADEVNVEDLFDLRAQMLQDPDAVAVAELLGISAGEVSETISANVSRLFTYLEFPYSKRKHVTAKEIVDGLVDKWEREHPEAAKPLTGPALRQVRTFQQRILAGGIEEILEEEKGLKR